MKKVEFKNKEIAELFIKEQNCTIIQSNPFKCDCGSIVLDIFYTDGNNIYAISVCENCGVIDNKKDFDKIQQIKELND